MDHKVIKFTSLFFLCFLTMLLFAEVLFSLVWRLEVDFPLLHYVAFLVDKYELVLYKDIFDHSMPGTFLFHLFLGKLFGFSDGGWLAVVNVVWLFMFLTITFAIMRSFGLFAAWASAVLFGLFYYASGPYMSLQRDYLALLPISLSLFIVFYNCFSDRVRFFTVGFLFGLSASMKPHLTIGLPVIFFFQLLKHKKSLKKNISYGFIEVLGLFIPILGCLLWVWNQGGLGSFFEICRFYTPLYLNITNNYILLNSSEKLKYIMEHYLKLGGNSFLLIPAVLGVYISLFICDLNSDKKKNILLIVSLAFVYSLYPVISGQFFPYHWMPFKYFLILLAATTLMHISKKSISFLQRLFPLIVLIFISLVSIKLPYDFHRQIKGLPPYSPSWGRVDLMVEYFRDNLKPGDKVQSLDWTGGAVHAMLLAQAELATSFIVDFYFYHNVSNPYIQSLRKRFLTELKQSNPKFIIEVFTHKPWISGVDSTASFDLLWEFILKNYSIDFQGEGYHIWKRTV